MTNVANESSIQKTGNDIIDIIEKMAEITKQLQLENTQLKAYIAGLEAGILEYDQLYQ